MQPSEPPAFSSAADYSSAFQRFLRDDPRLESYRGYRVASIEASAQHLGTLQRLLFDEGWSRVGWPERCGGLGGDPVCRAAMFEALTDADIPLPEGYLTLEILAPVLLVHAPHLAERFFAGLLRGEEFFCQAFSEPDAGSDMASLRTRLEPDGDGWRITGQKVWSSFGHLANRSVLLARSGEPGHRGLTMVLVDLDQPSVEVRPIRTENGENHLAEIFLDGARIGPDRVIGQLGGGWGIAMYMLQWERGAWGWQQQGKFHKRLEEAIQAGGGGVRAADSVGRAYLAATALRVRARDTVRRLAREESLGPDTSVDKLLLVDAELAVWDAARHQLQPVLETDDRADVGDWWRAEFLYSRAAPIYGGSQEIQRTLVAQRVLGLPREP
ncbi:MAG TPA: acyl-CoA dehydrogenase family protein [Acidimicrobiales bacterium]|jgi:alkylation response protein AidB-like acyl-CoA dehydrogenase|nr:acyl-CoA dehydrogenase family protein [Acidimicrobiales bacterium]